MIKINIINCLPYEDFFNSYHLVIILYVSYILVELG